MKKQIIGKLDNYLKGEINITKPKGKMTMKMIFIFYHMDGRQKCTKNVQ